MHVTTRLQVHYLSARAACVFRKCSLNARMSPSNRCTPCANEYMNSFELRPGSRQQSTFCRTELGPC